MAHALLHYAEMIYILLKIMPLYEIGSKHEVLSCA